ncbi:MAG: hypothetical protein NC124_21365 [Clostridium sp.]|nr:hypothetical protein [Clostridium sp.]
MIEENLNCEGTALPIGANRDNVEKLLEAVKRKAGDEKGINATYGGAQFANVKKALDTLGLIKDYALTEPGRSIIYSTDEEERKKAYLNAVMSYKPYEYCLNYLAQSKCGKEIKASDVKNYWGKNNYGSSERNREDAFAAFACFLELAGIGELIIGRRGNESRINCSVELDKIIDEFDANRISNVEGSHSERLPVADMDNFTESAAEISVASSEAECEQNINPKIHVNSKQQPIVNINVDMSDWNIEKIEAFFKALYGDYANE